MPYGDEDIDREWGRFVTLAAVTVSFTDGTQVATRVDHPKDHPRHPMTAAEIVAKTADCATFAAVPVRPDNPVILAVTLAELESLDDASSLIRVITEPVRATAQTT